MRLAWRVGFVGLAFSAVGTAPASSYIGIARVSGPGLGAIGTAEGTSVVFAEDSASTDRIERFAQAVGQASDGFLTGYTRVRQQSEEVGLGGDLRAEAGGILMLTDLVVTRLPGFEGLPDTVEATAQFAFTPDSHFGLIDNVSGGLNGSQDFSEDGLSSASPILASIATVPVNQPLQLSLSVQITARLEGDLGTVSGGFATRLAGTEAILLPEGYVANSGDGRIVDNVYLRPFAPATGGVAGDYNFDGLVDAADYTVWRDRSDAGLPLPNDTTPESVSIADYDLWRSNYGGPTAAALAAPEPTAAVLLILGVLAGGLAWPLRRQG